MIWGLNLQVITCHKRLISEIMIKCQRTSFTSDGGSGSRGAECTNGLNTNDCSLEASPTLATGLDSPPPPLKKGGIGNVPVVGDGSDCTSVQNNTPIRTPPTINIKFKLQINTNSAQQGSSKINKQGKENPSKNTHNSTQLAPTAM